MLRVLSRWVSYELLATSTMLGLGVAHGQEVTATLPTVQVEGVAESASTRGSYLKPGTTTATKTDTPVLQTPQSMTTITRKQIDDQNPQTVKDALNYTAGVLSSPDSNSRFDSLFIRGFGGFGTSTQVVDFLDGLRLPRGQAFALPSIDPFLLDHIDVLKGPSAILYGATSPGGLVNQVSRLPDPASYSEVRLEGGSNARLQGGFTSQGALDKDGRWQYSLTGEARRSGTRYTDVREERVAIAPALRWQPDADTRLTVQAFYQYDPKGGYFNSIYPRSLAPDAYRSALSRTLNVGDPGYDGVDRRQYGVGYSFDHRINDYLAVSSKLRYFGIDNTLQSLQMASALTSGGLIPRQAVRSIEDVGGIATDNHLQADFRTGPIKHKVLAGADIQHSASNWRYQYGAAPSLNVSNPQYGVAVGPLTTIIDNRQTLQQVGTYVQDQLSLGGLQAIAGARYDWTQQDTENRLTGMTSRQSSNSPSYRLGLLYKFDSGLAPYVSYSTSFNPTVGVDASSDPFKPTKGRQWELGLKYEPSFIKALFTASVFDIHQDNVLTPGSTAGFYVQQGEVRSRGVEFEARGNATRNLEFIGTLTVLGTEVTKSTIAATIGKRPQATPTFYGSAWANYSFDFGPLDGLTLGAGIRVVGSSFADDPNTMKTGGFALVDAALRYDLGKIASSLEKVEATVNATNIANKSYYSSCTYNYYCQYGNGATVLFGLKYRM